MNEKLKVRFFDVGHGDHIVIEFPNGDIGIVDSCHKPGRSGPPGVEYLLNLRRDRGGDDRPLPIRFVCVTHPHGDHVKGIWQILENRAFEVEELWHSMSLETAAVLRHVNERSVRVYGGAVAMAEYVRQIHGDLGSVLDMIERGMRVGKPKIVPLIAMRTSRPIGGVDIESVSPGEGALRLYYKQILDDEKTGDDQALRDCANRLSAMLLLQFGSNRVLLTGDAADINWREFMEELGARGRVGELPYEVVKAAHHGSNHGLVSDVWGAMVSPSGVVCVSAAGGTAGPSEAFYSVNQNRRVFCTNAGRCCHRRARLGPLALRQPGRVPCCGNITVVVGKSAGDIQIETERTPLHDATGRDASGRRAGWFGRSGVN